MATAATHRPGIISWALGIRTTMANDPGRQSLEDQIQFNGFSFLDDYMNDILAGPKQDPIIELVKTPGRKKDVPKRTRAAMAAAARVKAVVSLSLEEEVCKENIAPETKSDFVNSFHKTLLQASNTDVSPKKGTQKAIIITNDPKEDEDDERAVEALVTPPHARFAVKETLDVIPLPAADFTQDSRAVTLPEIPIELSVIAEDDESTERDVAESIYTSVDPPQAKPPLGQTGVEVNTSNLVSPPVKDVPQPESTDQIPSYPTPVTSDLENMIRTSNFTRSTSTSVNSFHSITLDSPAMALTQDQDRHAVTPLPQLAPSTVPLTQDQCITDPSSSISTPAVPDPQESMQKTSISNFPTIGLPSPLRKSMRIPRAPSLVAAAIVPATSNNAARSSWLVKAREAKAIEESSKRMSVLTTAPVLSGLKRKSGEALIPATGLYANDGSDRKAKVSRLEDETSVNPQAYQTRDGTSPPPPQPTLHNAKSVAEFATEAVEQTIPITDGPSGEIMDRLKKTVEGFSARAGKSMGKSLGGAAATALAEAKAAAEARVAERNAAEGKQMVTTSGAQESTAPIQDNAQSVTDPAKEHDKRLSISDLVTVYETKRESKEPERVFQPPPPSQAVPSSGRADERLVNASVSATSPCSPPLVRPSVFSAPQAFKLPPPPTFLLPPSSQLPVSNYLFPPATSSELRQASGLSAQSTFVSTQSSTFSDTIFDHDTPAWLPSSQETEYYSAIGGSQPLQEKIDNLDDMETEMEADESWHIDDKFHANQQWATVDITKDDTMTWSTIPTQSVRGDTGSLHSQSKNSTQDLRTEQHDAQAERDVSIALPLEDGRNEVDMEMDDAENDVPADQIQFAESTSTSLMESQSQSKKANSQSSASTSQLGFLSTASKLVSSVLGSSKKGKAEPVKSLQLAAAAAKKQQEEKDKKSARLKEMEARRQQVIQKKADEEKAREKKIKEENDKKKRDREETTEKRALRGAGNKIEEDPVKKRKPDVEKKPDVKKPPSKEKDTASTSRIGKPGLNSSQVAANNSSVPAKSLKPSASSSALNASTSVKLVTSKVEAKVTTTGAGNGSTTNQKKAKGKAKESSLSEQQPARVLNAQMQARVQAQLEELRKGEDPKVTSESIELPDINSEYSDSDDEDRVRTFDPPNWAQSPDLREALQVQSTVNPDDIFGAVGPLRMEELFKTKTSRFRARTSSANWAGTDQLTAHEEREYARRMGYKS